MSYYLIDFSKLSNDYDFDNLIIGKKIKLDQNNCKYYIYYNIKLLDTISDTLNEIYIKLPKIRLLYNLANFKYNKLSIPIYPNWDLTNNFIDWIKNLENNIIECFSNNKTKREFVSIISKKNTISFLTCYLNDTTKITSNLENKLTNTTFNDFKINGQVEIVIKLSYIWANNNKYGLSSSIYQIKYYAPPDQLNINFIDFDNTINTINVTDEYIYSSTVFKSQSDIIKNKSNIILQDKQLPPQLAIRNSSELCSSAFHTVNSANAELSACIRPDISKGITKSFQVPSLKDLQGAIKSLKPSNCKPKDLFIIK